MKTNERTPLLLVLPSTKPLLRKDDQGHRHGTARRFLIIALQSVLVLVIVSYTLWNFFVRIPSPPSLPPPIVEKPVCYSDPGTSKAYVSAEALQNNVNSYCQEVANDVPWVRSKRQWTMNYYQNTPDEYRMTVTLPETATHLNIHQCKEALNSIINECDVPLDGRNPMNWKQGGSRMLEMYKYQIDIVRQNRPWPPPTKPRQSCVGWYKFFFQHYDLYGAGWANYDWGRKTLQPAINPCCGLGSLTGWHFEYYEQPDKNDYEWHAWFNTAIGTRRRCFDNNKVQCSAGGPCDSFCGGNG